MRKHTDLSGVRFGRAVAIAREERAAGRVRFVWRMRCDCGAEFAKRTDQLRRTIIVMCSACRWHGHSVLDDASPTYNSWVSMISRCSKTNNASYKWYGARGVRVCEDWRDFRAFLRDMGERPAGTTLDRIDNNGDYEKSNCRWADNVTQGRNTRSVKLDRRSVSEIKARLRSGESCKAIADIYGIHHSTVRAIRAKKSWGDVA